MLKNLAMRPKLLLMLLVPIAGLLIFSCREVSDSYLTLKNVTAVKELTGLAVKAGDLAHEMQKERGFSAGFINSHGERFREELTRQRVVVDGKVQSLTNLLTAKPELSARVGAPLSQAKTRLAGLRDTRQLVDAQRLTTTESFQYYTGVIASYLDTLATIATASHKHEVMRIAAAYYGLVKAKEATGQERATLNAVLAAGKFDPETWQKTFTLVAAQKIFLEIFQTYASAAEIAAYQEKSQGPAFAKVDHMTDAILAKGINGGFDVTPEEWFSTITGKIDVMKELEDLLARDILAKADDLAGNAMSALTFSVLFSGFVIAISLTIGFFIFTSITVPLARMVGMLKDIAEGEGDLTRRLDEDRGDEIGEVSHWFNRFVDNVHGIVSQVAGNADHISTSSGRLNATAEQIATAAEEVAQQSGTVATASEEMSVTSADISRSCASAADVAQRAGATARTGADVVHTTISGMEKIAASVRESAGTVAKLGERSDQIGAIVGAIEEIADQTNLLALNAAIEAARAGEQGRGFAVVADEVRALADRTTKATKEIASMIKAIQRETAGAVQSMENGVRDVEQGMEGARRSGRALEEILGAIDEVNAQVQQMATAAEEQTAVTTEISGNIHQINEVVTETARGAHQTASAAAQLSSLADGLQRMVSRFRLA